MTNNRTDNSISAKDELIKRILQDQDYVTAEDIKKAEGYAKTHHTTIVEYLITEELVTKDLLGQAIAEHFKMPYADLSSNKPPRELVLKIPEEVAKKYRIVLFQESNNKFVIATNRPEQPKVELGEELKKIFKEGSVILNYSLAEDIDEVFIYYRKALETRFSSIIEKQKRVAPEIIDEILEDALSYQASDVHFEPQEEVVVIRFRIDGVLHEAGRIPKEYYDNILNRIKIQSHLRIDEHYSTQDGALRYKKEGNIIDLRISVVPTLDGEKVAIRLLSHYVRGFTLADLGLSAKDHKLIAESSKKPFGMILATGPTGSGKTTTLYALIKILNHPEVNIMTIEDPIEYKVVGTNQIQVNPQTGLTFNKGLRSIVRQDPDIILVGEVRDEETAEIAVNSALTGHLLLSTFHSNDASTSIPRLLDMGIEPFLIASTMELVIAQRLVRRICEKCRHSYSITREDIEKNDYQVKNYFSKGKTTLYKGKGCSLCSDTGYKGRIALFEFLNVTREMKDLILKNPSTKQVWSLAKKQGMKSLFEDGIEKVKNGVTTLEEVLRVTAPPYS